MAVLSMAVANQNIIDESFLIKLRQNTNHGRKLYILDEDTANSDFKKVIKNLSKQSPLVPTGILNSNSS